jgi:hypothetical protein
VTKDSPSARPEPERTPEELAKARTEAETNLAKAAEAGDARAAAAAIRTLRGLQRLDPVLDARLRAALTHVADGELAKAETMFLSARQADEKSELARQGYEAVNRARVAAEQQAVAVITQGKADPLPAAKTLAAGFGAADSEPRIRQAFRALKSRADRETTSLTDVELAQVVLALGVLENVGGDMQQRLEAAAGLLRDGKAAEAETAFGEAQVGVLGDRKSEVAGWARAWIRARRIRALEQRVQETTDSGDVIAESIVVQALLDLDPKNRLAKSRARDLKRRVVKARLAAADAALKKEEYGVAFLFAQKGLEVAPTSKELQSRRAQAEDELKARMTLVFLVDAPRRVKQAGGSACEGFAPRLQARMMENGSRREDLGSYTLSEAYTRAWTDGVPKVIREVGEIEGLLELVIRECSVAPGAASTTVEWTLRVPRKPTGASAASGTVKAEVDGSSIPLDEQDADGRGARQALAEESSKQIADRISEQRDDVDQWLLHLASYYIQEGDDAAAADAYARLLLDKPITLDEDLMVRVSSHLATVYR